MRVTRTYVLLIIIMSLFLTACVEVCLKDPELVTATVIDIDFFPSYTTVVPMITSNGKTMTTRIVPVFHPATYSVELMVGNELVRWTSQKAYEKYKDKLNCEVQITRHRKVAIKDCNEEFLGYEYMP